MHPDRPSEIPLSASTAARLVAGVTAFAVLIPAQPVAASEPSQASTLAAPPQFPAQRSTGLSALRVAVVESRATRVSRKAVRSHGSAAHMRLHTWLNRLHAAYRFAHTRERRIQLGRAVRITKARILRDHAATVRRARAARIAKQQPRGMAAVVAFAVAQVGKPYRYGATGPSSWDCSSLVRAAYRRAGISLPRTSSAQRARARSIPRSQARPGDLVSGPGHVGVYLGGGMMVDAGNRRVGVVKRRLYAGLSLERF